MKKLFVILGIFCTCSALSQESFTFPKDVKPLIATRWGQWYPFNALAPAVEHDGMKVRPAAGCGAVAMAQIVNFHKYPCYSPDGEYEYKWDLMYHRASNDLRNDQIVSVAKLISDCGVSAFTKYGKEESGSSLRKLMNGLKRLYGYSDYIGIYNRNRYTTAKGDSILPPGGVRGHEFHYWDSTNCGESWKAVKTSGKEYRCGHEEGALVAGYPHLYYYSNPEVAYRFLLKCSRYGN